METREIKAGFSAKDRANWGRLSVWNFLVDTNNQIAVTTDPALLAQLGYQKSFFEKRYAAYVRDYTRSRQTACGFNSSDITRVMMLQPIGDQLELLTAKIQMIRAEQTRVWGLTPAYNVAIKAILESTYGLATPAEYTTVMEPVYDLEYAFYHLVDDLANFQIENTGGMYFVTYSGVTYYHLLALCEQLQGLVSSPEMDVPAGNMRDAAEQISAAQFDICANQITAGSYTWGVWFGIIDDIANGRYTLSQCQTAVASYLAGINNRMYYEPLNAQSLAYKYGVITGFYNSIFAMNV